MIYSAFPGTGKTFAANQHATVIDAESSNFQWLDANGGTNEDQKGNLTKKNPNWPENYVNYIIEKSQNNDVLIASQPIVLDLLDQKNINYSTVSPSPQDKSIYLNRYEKRGNKQTFIDLMSKNFDSFIEQLNKRSAVNHITLKNNQYLNDIL